MKRFSFIIAIIIISVFSYAKAEGCAEGETSPNVANADSILESSGKIESLGMIQNYRNVSLDYVASELTGTVSPKNGGDTFLVHRLSVIVDGINYYPEPETIEERAKDNLPLTTIVNGRINPEEIVCRNGTTKTFRILLPDQPKIKKGRYEYRIEYYADTSDGGICNYSFSRATSRP